mmetsp:Transcript_80908/g.224799  ORF Transcript_80908/g.224799 Transcript_80908/m.224799 type:complete len:264 (-) Transcript_80908:238-1029(-)
MDRGPRIRSGREEQLREDLRQLPAHGGAVQREGRLRQGRRGLLLVLVLEQGVRGLEAVQPLGGRRRVPRRRRGRQGPPAAVVPHRAPLEDVGPAGAALRPHAREHRGLGSAGERGRGLRRRRGRGRLRGRRRRGRRALVPPSVGEVDDLGPRPLGRAPQHRPQRLLRPGVDPREGHRRRAVQRQRPGPEKARRQAAAVAPGRRRDERQRQRGRRPATPRAGAVAVLGPGEAGLAREDRRLLHAAARAGPAHLPLRQPHRGVPR